MMTFKIVNLVYIDTEPFTPFLYFRVSKIGHIGSNIPHSFLQAEAMDYNRDLTEGKADLPF